MPRVFTIGEVARHFGVETWKVRRLFQTGRLQEVTPRVGAYRIVSEAELPSVEAALVAAGYLPARGEVAHAS